MGTIYRAITGDVIPDAVRIPGSMLASGLLGGPIGVVSNIALLIGEKATGVDPEKIVSGWFHSAPPTPTPPVPAVAAATSPVPVPRLAWSPQQLAAYGVSVDASGTLHRGVLEGADVLNEMELARIGKAASAYAAVIQGSPA